METMTIQDDAQPERLGWHWQTEGFVVDDDNEFFTIVGISPDGVCYDFAEVSYPDLRNALIEAECDSWRAIPVRSPTGHLYGLLGVLAPL